MVLEPVKCPTCGSTNIVKQGKSTAGKQRYKCRHTNCKRRTLILNYSSAGVLTRNQTTN